MQNVILFSDTIANNIKVGNQHATQEEIEEAARRAMIHDFIINLPEGYETKIGENGLGLSEVRNKGFQSPVRSSKMLPSFFWTR